MAIVESIEQDESIVDGLVVIPTSARTHDGFRAWVLSDDFPRHLKAAFVNDRIIIEMLESCPEIPTAALTHEGFQQWIISDEFPSRMRATFAQDRIFIDMSPEELETHNKVKNEITRALGNLEHELDLGTFYGDRTALSHPGAGLSAEPDGLFVRWESFEKGIIHEVPRRHYPGQYTQLVGTPDLVVEVVSVGSTQKDRVFLRKDYHAAGIPEYWLIDARQPEINFVLLVRTEQQYQPAAIVDGWQYSPVLEREFLLERIRNRRGRWRYSLQSRPVSS